MKSLQWGQARPLRKHTPNEGKPARSASPPQNVKIIQALNTITCSFSYQKS